MALGRAYEAFTRRITSELERRGYAGLDGAHANVFSYLDLEGTRSGVIAERMGVTKQAAGQFVDTLERLGYVERADDPTDLRAKIVRYTKKGMRYRRDADAVRAALERQLAAKVGTRAFAGTRAHLREIAAALHDSERRGARRNGRASSGRQ